MWPKIILVSISLFFVSLADAIISFWAPNLVQTSLGNSVAMGFVISFQSVIGFGADIIFPNLLKKTRVRRLIFLAIFTCFLTVMTLVGATYKPIVLLFLIAMTFWGLYYEFIAFAQYQFVADTVPSVTRTSAWGVMGIFKNFAYFIGPLVAVVLLTQNSWLLVFSILPFLFVSLMVAARLPVKSDDQTQVYKVNIYLEIKHWLRLSHAVWPLIVISLFLGFIDACFWTTGAVMTLKLMQQNILGGLFLPLYSLPPLFVGLIIAKLGIFKGKKKIAEIFLLLSGFVLLALPLKSDLYWQLAIVFIVSTLLSICYPFVEGVYSDIDARLKDEKKHMIGLTSSVVNLSYIFWPIVAGFVAGTWGGEMAFSVTGMVTVIAASILLVTTPRKLRLPQKEIHQWPD